MSDSHRPLLSLAPARVVATGVVLAVLATAAVTGLVVRSDDRGPDATGNRHAVASTHTPDAAVPAADVSSSAAAPPTAAPPTAAPPTAAPSSPPAVTPANGLTYVVRPGDNLFVIAAWFHLHGYGDLYDRNRAAIGNDPSLIHPGLRITVSSTGISTS